MPGIHLDSRRLANRAGVLVLVLGTLWGAWELWHFIGTREHVTWPFPVNGTTMPHIHDVVHALFQPVQAGGPWLIDILWHNSLFTLKESVLGLAIGAAVGFAIAVVLSQSPWLERGVIPYVVASQTIPLLAIAPMVVIGLGTKGVTDWISVSILAAYLTFFPVTINTLRGLQSADPRAVELMRSYAASRLQILWKLRVPAALPFLFSAFRIAAPLAIVGAIICEPAASIQGGLGGAIVNFSQYYSIEPQELWATNIVAAILGIGFFLAVVAAEKAIVRRAPGQAA